MVIGQTKGRLQPYTYLVRENIDHRAGLKASYYEYGLLIKPQKCIRSATSPVSRRLLNSLLHFKGDLHTNSGWEQAFGSVSVGSPSRPDATDCRFVLGL